MTLLEKVFWYIEYCRSKRFGINILKQTFLTWALALTLLRSVIITLNCVLFVAVASGVNKIPIATKQNQL